MEIITKNADETKDFGAEIANKLKGGEIICLEGDLGSGKTTFVQGLAAALNLKGRVVSPTFILMRQYSSEKLNLYHIDLYRLETNLKEEIENLGIFDIWGKTENIVVIEWAEKIKDLLPQDILWIKFENLSQDERKISLNG